MEKFNKKGVYLFAIKNLGDEVEVYWDKEYEYDIYYFKSQSIYRDNRLGYMDKPDSKTEFFVETVKGLVPKELKNAKYMTDDSPIDPKCDCPVCRRYSKAYIRHLFVAEEMLAMRLSVMHNLYFYNKLMEKIRNALDEGTFEAFRREYSGKLSRRI